MAKHRLHLEKGKTRLAADERRSELPIRNLRSSAANTVFQQLQKPTGIAIPILHTLRRFPENTIVLLFYCDKLDPAPDPSVVAFALP
jgi:hypothetical protein